MVNALGLCYFFTVHESDRHMNGETDRIAVAYTSLTQYCGVIKSLQCGINKAACKIEIHIVFVILNVCSRLSDSCLLSIKISKRKMFNGNCVQTMCTFVKLFFCDDISFLSLCLYYFTMGVGLLFVFVLQV